MKAIGIDLIEIERIASSMTRFKQAFLEKILTLHEQDLALTHKNPTCFVAGRFAAKEAIAKALKTGFGKHLSFHDIEITNDTLGAPLAKLSEKARKHFNNPNILLSISHSKSMATAVACVL
ncbi:holo-[acyl-carrier-protein] synthase [Candidatus Aerophobetes bacterium]|uniref:Holo-[acyl-carrier-protein] synthase n=1 Tax=Aerophobetes bacterium TaxID=2030807 RepID=A0A2A4X6F6_UNCAE|nr:MAG: holo-[acyl-carrier-protein] synthase [Candidatus Aerophobetes bacterium]